MSLHPDVVLGQLIRRMRAEAGLSCLALARAIGVDPVRLARLEAGSGLLLFSDIVPILRACDANLAEFGAQFETELDAAAAGASVDERIEAEGPERVPSRRVGVGSGK